MTQVDLHALINLRGAGNAQKELIKAGEWNAAVSNDPNDKEFSVTMRGSATWEKTVKIWARDASAAEDKAFEMELDIADGNIEDIEIDDANAKEGD